MIDSLNTRIESHSDCFAAQTNALVVLNKRMDHITASDHANYTATRLLFERSGGQTMFDLTALSEAYNNKMAELSNARKNAE